MIYDQSCSIPLYFFEKLHHYSGIKHFVSTRQGGVSKAGFASLNTGYGVGDPKENVGRNIDSLAERLGIGSDQLIFPIQTHGDHIKILDNKESGIPDLHDTDGLITDKKGIFIAVRTADCVPLLLYDPVKHVAGVVHAGWKGTVKNITGKAVQRMKQHWGTDPADMIAGIGPSIGPLSYEVGQEVIDGVERCFGKESKDVLSLKGHGKAYFDLWEANALLLIEEGLKKTHIEIAGYCTWQYHQTFFSARRAAGKGGRFASGMMLL